MKEQRHRILCAVCALALVLTAVLAPAAWAADGAGEVQDTAKPTLTTDDAAEMQQADAAVTALTGSDEYEQMSREERLTSALAELDELARKGIIIIRDVIEHIPNQELFLPFIKRFLSPHGIIFVAFPPWQNPFGGHQQICNNKLLSHLPWFHLLPRPVYKKVLEWGNVNPGGLLEIKDTGISLERFLSIVHKEKYRIAEEILYFINPNYETKFNLHPRRLWRFLNIPYIRNFYTTCGYYILKNS